MTRSALDNPETAAFVWTRFRRMMRWCGAVAVLVMIAVTAALWPAFGPGSIHLYIASALAAGGIVMLVGALMGLVFLSSGTGHDEAVRDWQDDA